MRVVRTAWRRSRAPRPSTPSARDAPLPASSSRLPRPTEGLNLRRHSPLDGAVVVVVVLRRGRRARAAKPGGAAAHVPVVAQGDEPPIGRVVGGGERRLGDVGAAARGVHDGTSGVLASRFGLHGGGRGTRGRPACPPCSSDHPPRSPHLSARRRPLAFRTERRVSPRGSRSPSTSGSRLEAISVRRRGSKGTGHGRRRVHGHHLAPLVGGRLAFRHTSVRRSAPSSSETPSSVNGVGCLRRADGGLRAGRPRGPPPASLVRPQSACARRSASASHRTRARPAGVAGASSRRTVTFSQPAAGTRARVVRRVRSRERKPSDEGGAEPPSRPSGVAASRRAPERASARAPRPRLPSAASSCPPRVHRRNARCGAASGPWRAHDDLANLHPRQRGAAAAPGSSRAGSPHRARWPPPRRLRRCARLGGIAQWTPICRTGS